MTSPSTGMTLPSKRARTTVRPKPSGLSVEGTTEGIDPRSPTRGFVPRREVDSSGFSAVIASLPLWTLNSSLKDIATIFDRPGFKAISRLDSSIEAAERARDAQSVVIMTGMKATLLHSEGEPIRAYEVLKNLRSQIEPNDQLARESLTPSSTSRGSPRCAAARTRTASCAGARARASSRSRRPPSTPTPPARAWRSGISPSTSSSSPTTSRSAGCSTWPT